METGDRQTEDRDTGIRTDENVIRLPREWLGPPEELVPIGRAAIQDLSTDDPSFAGTLPPTADAFWSEDSAALHDAVQGPTATATAQDSSGRRTRPHAERHASAAFHRLSARTVRRALLALPAVALLIAAAIGFSDAPGRPAATKAAKSKPTASTALASAAGGVSEPRTVAAATVARLWAVDSTRHVTSRLRAGAHRPSRIAHSRGRGHGHASASTPAPVFVRASNTSSSSSATSQETPPAPNSPTVSSSATSSAPPTHHAATSSPTTTFGQDGTLGPGTSPDS